MIISNFPNNNNKKIEELNVALSTKQSKLTGTSGQVVGFGADGAAQAVRGWSNQNLLINGDLRRPVNRNGKMEYSAGGYTIDRWKNESANGTVTLNDGSVTFSWDRANSSEFAAFTQVLDYKELLGKVCTWSLVASGTGYICLAACDNSRVAITLTNEPKLYSITAQLETLSWLQNHAHFRVVADAPMSLTGEMEIFAAKLELGAQQTLAHQDADGNWVLNDPPDYALQYALCSLYSPITGEWVGNQHSNQNLLDNGYFADAVNQRGQAEYTAAGYTIDRWKLASGTMQVFDGGITLTPQGDVRAQIVQAPENPAELYGKVVTLSFYIDGQIYSQTVSIPQNPFYPFDATTAEIDGVRLLVYQGAANAAFQVGLRVEVGAGAKPVAAAKLELGSVQTLAHQDADGSWVLNDPPPNKALELAKCQRYYQRTISRGAYDSIAFGIIESNNSAKIILSAPSAMRANPAISFSGAFKLVEANSSPFVSHPVTSMALSTLHDGSCTLNVTTSDTDCVVGTHCFLMGAEVGAHIDRDANL